MKSVRLWVWLVPIIAYAAFWVWYTPLSGPMTQTEIDDAVAYMEANDYPEERIALVRGFLEADDGGSFIMLNIMDAADNPPSLPDTGPEADADALLGHYMEYMWPALLSRACHPLFMGEAVGESMDIVGINGAERWDTAATMRYRSRRDLWEIASNPVFGGRHEYKVAALEKTVAFPVRPQLLLSDPRLLLALLLLAVLGVVDALIWRRKR